MHTLTPDLLFRNHGIYNLEFFVTYFPLTRLLFSFFGDSLFFSSRALTHSPARPSIHPSILQRISREEFRKGCELINGSLPGDSEQRLTNIDHTLDLMDFDGTGDIDINEFFEVSNPQITIPSNTKHSFGDLFFDSIIY